MKALYKRDKDRFKRRQGQNVRVLFSIYELQYGRRVMAALELGFLNFCVLFTREEKNQK